MRRSPKHKVLDLFSGIGGFSLGLERAGGFETVAFCENDKPCQRVLRKHWPDVPIFDDVTELTIGDLYSEGIKPSLICGGFPCQNISKAGGDGKGIHGEESSLWKYMLLLIRDVRPEWAVIENVSALRLRGLACVLQDLCEIDYVCEFHSIPAYTVGSPQIRDRIFIISHPKSESKGSDSNGSDREQIYSNTEKEPREKGDRPSDLCKDVADSNTKGLQGRSKRLENPRQILTQETISLFRSGSIPDQWATEPELGRVAHGIPNRVDRLKQLGNSLVPQIPEMIGSAIMEFEDAEKLIQI